MPNRRNTEADFWAKVDKNGPLFEGDPCWIWNGTRRHGYGCIWFHNVQVYAHRLAYEFKIWPIGDGLHLHHRCVNTFCVNPAHLIEVPRNTHPLLDDTIVAKNVAKTACDRGHEFTPENTRIYRGSRICRACGRQHNREVRAARKACL